MTHKETIAARLYPNGMPGLLSMKEFCMLLGVSRPTGLSIVRNYPEFTVPRGNTQYVSVGLYQRLTRDEDATASVMNFASGPDEPRRGTR